MNADKASPTSVIFRSFVVIGLLGALLLVEHLLLTRKNTINNAMDGMVDNAMQQRLLFERTQLLTEQMVITPDHARPAVREELLNAIQLMEASQIDLAQREQSLNLSTLPWERFRPVQAWTSADSVMKRYMGDIKALAQTPDAELKADQLDLTALRQFESASSLRNALQKIVRQYQQERETRLTIIGRIEFLILATNTILIVILALFGFRPIINHIKSQNAKLKEKSKKLEAEIIERKQAQRELQSRHEQLRIFVDHIPAAVAMFDDKMHYIMTSRRWQHDYGISEQDIIGRSHYEVLPQMNDMQEWKAVYQLALEGEVQSCEEDHFRRSDGTLEWVRWEVHPWHEGHDEIGGIIMFTEVITERKHAEEELRKHRDHLEELVEERTNELKAANEELAQEIVERKRSHEMLDRFFTLSLDLLGIAGFDGYFKKLNPIWQETLGYSMDELLGKPYLEFVHPQDKESTSKVDAQLTEGKEIINFENRYLAKDGSWRWLSWKSSMHVEEGLVYFTARDVTERKRLEESLRQAKEAAEAATKAKSTFLANMSHELRTPLNSIIGFSEMLAEQVFGELNQRQARYIHNILSSGRHLLQLINDILDLSKVEAGRMQLEPTRFKVGEAITEALSIVSTLADQKGITFELMIDESIPLVSADEGKFKQILYNLCSNAIKFTKEGGSVRILANLLMNSKPEVQVSVCDTGIGIEPEDEKRIFGEFEQIENTYSKRQQGTGLGLALTQRLVELHQGRIWVESEGAGKGSTFSFVIPVEAVSQGPSGGDKPAGGANGQVLSEIANGGHETNHRPTVLIVEDERFARELLTEYLSGNGYKILHAHDGEQAVEMAREHQPDVITLDILLPKKDGWKVLQELNSMPETRDIPVIIVSITSERGLGMSLGAVELFVKPVNKKALLEVVQKLISKDGQTSKTVLIVDKTFDNIRPLIEKIRALGLQVKTAYSAKEGTRIAVNEPPDVIILDLVTSDATSLEIVSQLRRHPQTRDIPILLSNCAKLTSKDQKRLDDDFLKGFLSGSEFEKKDLLTQLKNLIK